MQNNATQRMNYFDLDNNMPFLPAPPSGQTLNFMPH